jgi:hypothetical protein
MNTSRIWSVFVAAAILAAPAAASGQVTVGPTLAYENDANFGIGASLGTALNDLGEGFGVLADFLVFFPDGSDYFELNGNVTYDFPLEDSSVVPFLLGGLNIARASSDLGGSNTNLGLNLGGGVDFDLGNFRPTAGVRAQLEGGDGLVFFITLPFQTGG